LRELNLAERTNIVVVSDHGFGHAVFGIDLAGELIKAGLKQGPDSDDVVIASSGQTALLHVRDHNAERIGAIVRFLQKQSFAGVLFTAGRPGQSSVPIEGREPGTFSLELIHLAQAERGPDIVLTFPWSSARNPFGVPGQDSQISTATGPLSGTSGNHGSMSPWTIRNTFIAWGPDFKRGATVRTPVSNVDLAPTLVTLMNLDKDIGADGGFDGRVLREALVDGPDEEQVPVDVRTHVVETADGTFRAAIQITELGRQRYVDKSWRIR
jgi:arylsulfatase A-like enzyme